MRILLLAGLGMLAGCPASCGGPSVVSGTVELAVEVDSGAFTALELRGHGMKRGDFVVEPSYRASIPIAEVTFPYEYFLEEHDPTYGDRVQVRAWLARDPAAPAPAPDEPSGKTFARMIHVADAGSYASDVVITLALESAD